MGPFSSIRAPFGGSLLRYRNQSLRRCLGSTNLIDSSHSGVRIRTRRVGRWKNADMAQRWAAASFLDTEKNFRRILGYKDLWMLQAKLNDLLTGDDQSKVA